MKRSDILHARHIIAKTVKQWVDKVLVFDRLIEIVLEPVL